MLVGFMRNAKNPAIMARIIAIMCRYYDMELIYIKPEDVDMDNQTVKGKMYIKNRWVNVEKELPPIIDISAYCFKRKNRTILNYLREHTFLTYDRKNALNKERLQRELVKDKEFAHLVIPTAKAKTFEDVENFLKKYTTIVMKPIHGEKGKGVYILKREGEDYILGYQKKEEKFNRAELETRYYSIVGQKKYIIQKYISSRTINGDPFDCRIHVQKDGKGKWSIAKKYIRIGIGQKVMSNVNQGGGISETKPFLQANFGEHWKEIEEKLNVLAKTLPYKMEELKNAPTMALGLDVAIDKNGDLYLFETNGAPATGALLAQSALLSTKYYQYVRKHKLPLGAKNTTNSYVKTKTEYEREIAELKQENQKLKKEYQAIKESTSWRVTAPLRKVSQLLKKK
ncbi:YheC/YheD family protein [Thalassobacillus sp. B23F22_16]|uniref:YheC/YheD family protein n=1 Tax=Thalassobacillus sp. B23F22_16 TaxID=3459513 RepID=UPI00373EFC02